MVEAETLLWSVLASLAVVAFSARRGHLTRGGGLATFLLGFSLGVGGGLPWFLAAVVVFGAVNVASRFRSEAKSLQAKGSTRDHRQILANAGLAIPAAVAFGLTGQPVAMGAFVGAFAFAGADTLASEIGTMSNTPPVSITTFRPIPNGTSGGVTTLGHAAALFGAALPVVGMGLGGATELGLWLVVALTSGLVGTTVDSILGDLWQQKRRCNSCGLDTEQLEHCGAETVHATGLPWLDNDLVNLLGSASSATVGVLIAAWAFRGVGG